MRPPQLPLAGPWPQQRLGHGCAPYQASATKMSFTPLSTWVPSHVARSTARVVWSEFFSLGLT
jgi:hypothetical protein